MAYLKSPIVRLTLEYISINKRMPGILFKKKYRITTAAAIIITSVSMELCNFKSPSRHGMPVVL